MINLDLKTRFGTKAKTGFLFPHHIQFSDNWPPGKSRHDLLIWVNKLVKEEQN